MTYVRRMGDDRPFKRPTEQIGWKVGLPVRWLPRYGEPYCVLEWISQTVVRLMAYLPVYTAVAVTLTLLVLLWVNR